MAGNDAAVRMMEEAAALMDDVGLTVKASSGWKSRGRSADVHYWAVLAHHTASTSDNDALLINGRPDLSGPLCNWALHADGSYVLIASGRANHAGEGTLPSSESQGIEATGPWGYPDTYGPKAFKQYDQYELGMACLLAAMNADVDDLFGHKETARPVGRKIDPYFDMEPFRKGVATAEEDDLSVEDAKTGALQALRQWDSERPANLSSDTTNKPLTLTEVQGVWGTGIVGIEKDVDKLKSDVAKILDLLQSKS